MVPPAEGSLLEHILNFHKLTAFSLDANKKVGHGRENAVAIRRISMLYYLAKNFNALNRDSVSIPRSLNGVNERIL
jgi:hypothetical protein